MAEFSQPKVPIGLRDLMKDLIKEILKEKPDDIYQFAERYFQAKLSQKENFSVKNFEKHKNSYDFSSMEWNYSQRYDIPIAVVYSIIPEDLTELIKDLIKAILREQPSNLCEFCFEFFQHIRQCRDSDRRHHTTATSYTSYENYIHNSEQYCKPYIRCACGRIFRSGFISRIPPMYPCQIASHRKYVDKNEIKYPEIHEGVEDDNNNNKINETKEVIGAKSRALASSQDYLKAACIIQGYCRRYLKRKNVIAETANTTNITMSLESAVIVIQKWLRKLLSKRNNMRAKSTSVETPLLLKIPEMDIDNISDSASYTSASTAVLSTDNDAENSDRTVIECNKSTTKSSAEKIKNSLEKQETDMDSIKIVKEDIPIETMKEGIIENVNKLPDQYNQGIVKVNSTNEHESNEHEATLFKPKDTSSNETVLVESSLLKFQTVPEQRPLEFTDEIHKISEVNDDPSKEINESNGIANQQRVENSISEPQGFTTDSTGKADSDCKNLQHVELKLKESGTLIKELEDKENIQESLCSQPIDDKANDALSLPIKITQESSQGSEFKEGQLVNYPSTTEKKIEGVGNNDLPKLNEILDEGNSLITNTVDKINEIALPTDTNNVKEFENILSADGASQLGVETKAFSNNDQTLDEILDEKVSGNDNKTDASALSSNKNRSKATEDLSENKEPSLGTHEETNKLSQLPEILNENDVLKALVDQPSQPSSSTDIEKLNKASAENDNPNDMGLEHIVTEIFENSTKSQHSNQITDNSNGLLGTDIENSNINLSEKDDDVKIVNQGENVKQDVDFEANISIEAHKPLLERVDISVNLEEVKVGHSTERKEADGERETSSDPQSNISKHSEDIPVNVNESKEKQNNVEEVVSEASNENRTCNSITESQPSQPAVVEDGKISLTTSNGNQEKSSSNNEELLLSDNLLDSNRTEHIETPTDVTEKLAANNSVDKNEISDILKSFLNSERNHLDITDHPTNSVLDEETIVSGIPYEIFEEPCIRKSAYQTIDRREDEANDASDLDNNSDDSLSSKTAKILKTDLVIEKMRMRRLSTINGHNDSLEKLKPSSSSFDEALISNLNPSDRFNGGEDVISNTPMKLATASDSSSQTDDVAYGELQTNAYSEFPTGTTIKETSSKHLQTTEDKNHFHQEAIHFAEPLASLDSNLNLDSDLTETIKSKMLAYSVSEEDHSIDSKFLSRHDRNDISTALVDNGDTSTETESTLVTAVTVVRALNKFESDRKNMKSKSSTTEANTIVKETRLASFGNAAITESLEHLVRDAAAKTIQTAFRRYHYLTKRTQPKNNATAAQDYAHRRQALLAQKRSMLQRGDAVISSSTPSPGHSNIITPMSTSYCMHSCCLQPSDGVTSPRIDSKLKWLKMRQNSMPVQIESEVFRILPKHISKRIQSAGNAKDSHGRTTRHRRNQRDSPNN